MSHSIRLILAVTFPVCLLFGFVQTDSHTEHVRINNADYTCGEWGKWSDCDVDCDKIYTTLYLRQRWRICSPDDHDCDKNDDNCLVINIFRAPCKHHCHVNGKWGPWGAFSKCSRTCGQGAVRTRQRLCNFPPPQNGGHQCIGAATNSVPCNVPACVVDGGWGTWHHWSGCSSSCGDGVRTRHRFCDHPAPVGGGKACTGPSVFNSSCHIAECAVDGGWGAWTHWSICSKSCGQGEKTRLRSCDHPVPQHGGRTCHGSSSSKMPCSIAVCPIDGGWGAWTHWSICSKSCGQGEKTRLRSCDHPVPQYGGQTCLGSSSTKMPCSIAVCPIDGGWGAWQQLLGCSVSCGNGSIARLRSCDQPSPQHGGKQCTGTPYSTTLCRLQECPVDGGWGAWNQWSSCTLSCGRGMKVRVRSCDQPPPKHGGSTCNGSSLMSAPCKMADCQQAQWSDWSSWTTCAVTCGRGVSHRKRTCGRGNQKTCPGKSFEIGTCDTAPCAPAAVDGRWGTWQHWTSFSVTCGRGVKSRLRSCDSPAPKNGGKTCAGSATMNATCEFPSCPTDGSWGAWQQWTSCSHSCGAGLKFRNRLCDNPVPDHGGKPCSGDSTMITTCILSSCPIATVDGGWGPWQHWSSFSVSCGHGVKTRHRSCDSPAPRNGGNTCTGSSTMNATCEFPSCPTDGSWGAWQQWTSCSYSCGAGFKLRNRVCDNPVPDHGGKPCSGDSIMNTACILSSCPIDGSWGAWQQWTSCSHSCGAGLKLRNRLCDNPVPDHGGKPCSGDSTMNTVCILSSCPIDGAWGTWHQWSSCSHTCGDGVKTRDRSCDSPTPQHGGKTCVGDAVGNKTCHMTDCVISGGWGAWSEWSTCTKTCGLGFKSRRRSCDNPAPQNGGMPCMGRFSSMTTCEVTDC